MIIERQKEGKNPLEDQEESELERLAALQELDRALKEKSELVATLERDVASMELELAEHREAIAVTTAERESRDHQRQELETRLEEEESKMKDRRMRLNRVRNERELMALRREIEVGKEANQQLEADILSALQTLEGLDASIAERAQALAGLEEKSIVELDDHRERIATLRSEIETERTTRDRVAAAISTELREKYEQIFARRGGRSVVEIRNGTCMGCHMHVPPQFFNELQKSRDVRLCPNCHRILIWRPETTEASASQTR
jgi:uncharacterized protein